jgi:ATP-dependent 26S proteasome regulatory subunit
MKKRLFEIIDEMNVSDIENDTQYVAVSSNFISADKIKQGARICMGAPESVIMDIISRKYIPVLLLIDSEEYSKRNQ